MNEIDVINKMQSMCVESCSPDVFSAWEIVKAHLMMVRKDLIHTTANNGWTEDGKKEFIDLVGGLLSGK